MPAAEDREVLPGGGANADHDAVEGKRFVSDGGALESFLLEAAAQSRALDAEQLRFIQESRDRPPS